MKILIVDDNNDDRTLLRIMIRKNGHEAIEAEDGFDGLKAAKRTVPDLIISDALMPVMDGFQFLREVKQDIVLNTIPFIFYSSSYKEYQDVRLAMSLGADAYIVKPIEPAALWEKIEELLRGGKKEKTAPLPLIKEDAEYLKRYSQVVATMLEEKVRELEQSLEERKRAEEALRTSEEHLRRVYENSPLAYQALDSEAVFVDVNPAWTRMMGYDRPEVVGRSFADFLAASSADVFRENFARFKEKGEIFGVEYVLMRKDGARIEIELNGRIGYDDEGNIRQTYCVLNDITERKRSERSLALLNFALSAMREEAYLIDEQGRYSYVNEEAARAMGYSRYELVGLTVSDVDPDFPPERWRAHWQDIKKQGSMTFEGRHKAKDGRLYPVEINANYFEYDGKAFDLALVRNITERKRTEEALREREQFIKNILETVDEGFIVVDRDYRIVSANKSFCAQAGLAAREVVGRFCYEVSHHAKCHCQELHADCPAKHTFETGTPYVASHEHLDRIGAKKHFEIKSYPITDASGAVTSAIETVTDITERKKLEEQLRHAQKLEALGTLAGGVAHDFNNILSVLVGYTALMEMHMQPDDTNLPYLREIRSATDRAAHLTQALLIFGRKQISELKLIDINELVSGMRKMVLRLIGEDIETNILLADARLPVMGDYGQLEQVLMNFATNARDAMPDGGILTLATQRLEVDEEFRLMHGFGRAGAYALITVSDTGEGMDERTRERIFEPFFTTKGVGKGTGLGLSIVYGIVQQHNGYIHCYSEPGKGTTFKVYLPLLKEELVEQKEAEQPVPLGGSETLLVADDDNNVRKMTRELLEKRGYIVIEAQDGQDAVSKFYEHRDEIRLVVLDVIMPRKSGKEVFDAIRALQPGIPTIFVSGYTDDIVQRKRIIEENLTLLQKPVPPRELLIKIRELLDRR